MKYQISLFAQYQFMNSVLIARNPLHASLTRTCLVFLITYTICEIKETSCRLFPFSIGQYIDIFIMENLEVRLPFCNFVAHIFCTLRTKEDILALLFQSFFKIILRNIFTCNNMKASLIEDIIIVSVYKNAY